MNQSRLSIALICVAFVMINFMIYAIRSHERRLVRLEIEFNLRQKTEKRVSESFLNENQKPPPREKDADLPIPPPRWASGDHFFQYIDKLHAYLQRRDLEAIDRERVAIDLKRSVERLEDRFASLERIPIQINDRTGDVLIFPRERTTWTYVDSPVSQ